MSRDLVDKIARAVLYEGYILYPYRPSVKSQQRWTFGGLYPPSWTIAQSAGDPSFMQTECLVAGDESAVLRVRIRFLHLIDRTVAEVTPAAKELSAAFATDDDTISSIRRVPLLTIGTAKYHPWQEAAERDVNAGDCGVKQLLNQPCEMTFRFPASRTFEPLAAADGLIAGVVIREQQAVEGVLKLSAAPLETGLIKLSLQVHNRTNMDLAITPQRDDALMRSLVSTHAILGIAGGEFISLTDPPARYQAHAGACHNIGNWPVLVGSEPDRDTLLASPIILYDYPQIAPESPGDLFDATEIDEILSLRILTLTDEEKSAVAGVDGKARDMLARTESLAREQLMGLHGTMRGMQPVPAMGEVEPEPIHG